MSNAGARNDSRPISRRQRERLPSKSRAVRASGAEIKTTHEDALEAENADLRDLLTQAGIDAARLLAQAGIDASESQAATRLQRLLLEELHHRVKNTLATVIAITSQSLRNAENLAEGRRAVESRLFALGRVHDLLLEAHLTSAKLTDLIRVAIEPFESRDVRRFIVHHAHIEISPEAVLPLAMSLNELCTNAVKYGALSNTVGSVNIAATIDENARRYILTWTEKDGPAVQKPTRNGFGTRLINRLAAQLRGNVQLRYEPTGLIYRLEVPMEALAHPPEPVAVERASTRAPPIP
jgi:two-component sensor histidine kinase